MRRPTTVPSAAPEWTSTSNIYDTDTATYATMTATTAANYDVTVSGFGFDTALSETDVVVGTTIEIRQWESNTSRFNSPTIWVYDGSTSIGMYSLQESTSSTHVEQITSIAPTLAQLRSSNFKVVIRAVKTGGSSASAYIADLNVQVEIAIKFVGAASGTTSSTGTAAAAIKTASLIS